MRELSPFWTAMDTFGVMDEAIGSSKTGSAIGEVAVIY